MRCFYFLLYVSGFLLYVSKFSRMIMSYFYNEEKRYKQSFKNDDTEKRASASEAHNMLYPHLLCDSGCMASPL